MSPVACRYCGLPFKVRRIEPGRDYFCCTGCAMLARVPVDQSGQFPVNAQLISILVVGFLYFNQLLFWLLGVLIGRDLAQAETALRFGWLTAATAVAVWLVVVVIQWRERTMRRADWVVAALVAIVFIIAWRERPPVAWMMAAANGCWLIFQARGLLQRKR